MSGPDRFPRTPLADLDFAGLKTRPLATRPGKVGIADLGRPAEAGCSFEDFAGRLPGLLAARTLREVAEAIARAARDGRGILLGMGAHPVKAGLGPVIAAAIDDGLVTGIATNGAAIIHDYELAATGRTSEDVGAVLDHGEFGMAAETAIALNGAIAEAAAGGVGIGSAVGRLLSGLPNAAVSVFAAAHKARVPATVHVAIGTDIIHMHPSCDGAATGAASLADFRLFTRQVAALDSGVYINLGSAVVMPEVFLKACSLARNLGCPVSDLTTVNMDFIQHYRPRVNVIERPTKGDGRGYALTGPHEIMLPMLLSLARENLP